jgi:hypothetical protein
MPTSNNDVRQDAINQIKSTSDDVFSNLSDDELFLICDIIRLRETNDWKIKVPSVQNLMKAIRYIWAIQNDKI